MVLLLLASTLTTGNLFAGDDTADEYRNILTQLKTKQRTMPPYDFIDLAEQLLTGFLEKYPEAPEAAGARLNLGSLYSSIGRHEDAIKHVKEYMEAGGEKSSRERVQAMYLLANSYLAVEKYDEAEIMLKKVVDSKDGARGKAGAAAARELARIGTLRKLRVGLPAIKFSAPAYGGKNLKLEDYKGKVVLLDFWASWCAPCRQEMPNVKKAYNEYHEKGFEIIGISLDDKESKFKGYVDDLKIEWPQIFDGKAWNSEVGRMYAVSSIPATYLLDRKGIIRYKNVRGGALLNAVKELIAEK